MANVLLECGREHDDAVDVIQAESSLEPGNDYIDGPLERRRDFVSQRAFS